MALIGHITRRDEDGTWYLAFVAGKNSSWSQARFDRAIVTGRAASDFMAETAECGWHQVTFHGERDPNRDDSGNWIGPVANENGWTP